MADNKKVNESETDKDAGLTDAEILDRHPAARRRAGLRPDERDPTDDSSEGPFDPFAAGSAGGGLAVGGLAGTNVGDGSPSDADIESPMADGAVDDDVVINEEENEAADGPYGGSSGGAVGGTPAGKRSTGGRQSHREARGDNGQDSTVGTNPEPHKRSKRSKPK